MTSSANPADNIIELTDIVEEGVPLDPGFDDFPVNTAVDARSLDQELDDLLRDADLIPKKGKSGEEIILDLDSMLAEPVTMPPVRDSDALTEPASAQLQTDISDLDDLFESLQAGSEPELETTLDTFLTGDRPEPVLPSQPAGPDSSLSETMLESDGEPLDLTDELLDDIPEEIQSAASSVQDDTLAELDALADLARTDMSLMGEGVAPETASGSTTLPAEAVRPDMPAAYDHAEPNGPSQTAAALTEMEGLAPADLGLELAIPDMVSDFGPTGSGVSVPAQDENPIIDSQPAETTPDAAKPAPILEPADLGLGLDIPDLDSGDPMAAMQDATRDLLAVAPLAFQTGEPQFQAHQTSATYSAMQQIAATGLDKEPFLAKLDLLNSRLDALESWKAQAATDVSPERILAALPDNTAQIPFALALRNEIQESLRAELATSKSEIQALHAQMQKNADFRLTVQPSLAELDSLKNAVHLLETRLSEPQPEIEALQQFQDATSERISSLEARLQHTPALTPQQIMAALPDTPEQVPFALALRNEMMETMEKRLSVARPEEIEPLRQALGTVQGQIEALQDALTTPQAAIPVQEIESEIGILRKLTQRQEARIIDLQETLKAKDEEILKLQENEELLRQKVDELVERVYGEGLKAELQEYVERQIPAAAAKIIRAEIAALLREMGA
ncbi:MAG: hypothetical protein GXY42_13205 [Desulfovibrionales bacterium]|nr:hypothetical protein [Desulfovibrionales bacterium]